MRFEVAEVIPPTLVFLLVNGVLGWAIVFVLVSLLLRECRRRGWVDL